VVSEDVLVTLAVVWEGVNVVLSSQSSEKR
jgi:hypothetical protein